MPSMPRAVARARSQGASQPKPQEHRGWLLVLRQQHRTSKKHPYSPGTSAAGRPRAPALSPHPATPPPRPPSARHPAAVASRRPGPFGHDPNQNPSEASASVSNTSRIRVECARPSQTVSEVNESGSGSGFVNARSFEAGTDDFTRLFC